MLIDRLTLRDFGIYRGEHSFELTPTPCGTRPLILIKGHNGSGKTTFLEAVRLALYGRRALGMRVHRAAYEKYLFQKINTGSTDSSASVQLVFSRNIGDLQVQYEVQRSWKASGQSVREQVELRKDREFVSGLSPEELDRHLEDMIPSGVSELFFFDGERIEEIAESEAEMEISEAFRSLLGLDLIKQLRKDLFAYSAKTGVQSGLVDIDKLEEKIKDTKNFLLEREEEAAEHRLSKRRAEYQISRLMKQFEDEGGEIATDRRSLQQSLRENEHQIQQLKTRLKQLVDGVAPLLLAPVRSKELKQRLLELQEITKHDAVSDFLEEFRREMKEEVSKLGSTWKKQHFDDLTKYLKSRMPSSQNVAVEVSPEWILSRLNRIDIDLRTETLGLATEIDRTYSRNAELKQRLKGYDEQAAQKALQELKNAEYELGVADTSLTQKEGEINSLRNSLLAQKKELEKSIDLNFDVDRTSERIQLAERTRRALAEYEVKVLSKRLEDLRTHFVECFNMLLAKKDLFEDVKVDRESFRFTLLDGIGKEVQKSNLSAGERQIFAIAMLWALSKCSGRELPMIIDTPLARLDENHRRKIAEKYLPSVSSQVILLCTDTEWTEEIEQILTPLASRRFEIETHGSARKTTISELGFEFAN